MQSKTIEKAMTRSLLYGFALAQPLSLSSALLTSVEAEATITQAPLAYGDHGELVRHVQYKLKKLGYYQDQIDGKYGLYTEQAVRSFQSSESLEVNGEINNDTYQRLIIMEEKEALETIHPLLEKISFGEVGERVRKVQEVLYFYGYYHGKVDGIYGRLTEEAIRRIEQTDHEPQSQITFLDKKNTNVVEKKQKHKRENDTPEPVPVQFNTTKDVISLAKSLEGTPYQWGGTTTEGFDCSGFIYYVYKEVGLQLPRTVNEIWNYTTLVDRPSIGDFVFFETYQPGPSHMGIYLGEGKFIHASSSQGVRISLLEENYWQTRYLGAKRINTME